jgi:hypothetical protein
MTQSTKIRRPRLGGNGVNLSLHRCKVADVARPGQQVVAGDRLADRIGIGVLTKVFTPELVDRVVVAAGPGDGVLRAGDGAVLPVRLHRGGGTSWSPAWTGRAGSVPGCCCACSRPLRRSPMAGSGWAGR